MASTSEPVLSTEDNFFAKAKTDYTYSNSQILNIAPSSVVSDHRLTFEIPKLTGPHCMQLNDLNILLKLKIVDHENKKPPDNAKVGPICYFTSTMFREVRMILNETEVSVSENGGYGIHAYTDATLNYSVGAKVGYFMAFSYFPDLSNHFQTSMEGYGMNLRRELFSHYEGEKLVFNDEATPIYGRVYTDLNSSTLPLISGVGVRLEFLLNDSRFYMQCLDSNADSKRYKLLIEGATLEVPMVTLNQSLYLDLEKRLLDSALHYPLKRTEMKKISIPANLMSFTTNAITQSSINPNRVLVILINETYFEGGYKYNPLEFGWEFKSGSKTASIQRMNLTMNGTVIQPIQSGSADQFALCAFKRLCQNLGFLYRGQFSNNLNPRQYKGGFMFNCFDVTQASKGFDGSARHPTKEGHLQLDIGFSATLPCPLTMFILNEYHSSISVDKNRNIMYEFLA